MAPPVESRRAVVRALLAKNRASERGLGQRRNAAKQHYTKKYRLTKKEQAAEAKAIEDRGSKDLGGTLLGALEDLGEGALTVLDAPRRGMLAATMGTAGVLAEGVEALGIKDYETDFFKKAGEALSGKYRGEQFLGDIGLGDDVARWGGLAYDIFVDPLTYAAPYAKFAGGAKKTSQVLEEGLSATLQAARKRGGLTAAEKATRTSGQAAIAAMRKRGGLANLSKPQVTEHFGKEAWNRGIAWTVPGTGRWAKALHMPTAKSGPIQAPFIPRSVTNKVMGPLNKGATKVTRSAKMAGIMDKLSSQTELGRGFTKEAQSGDPILAARGVSGEVGESAAVAASRTANQDLVDEYTPISEIIKANHENPADVIKAIETGKVEGVAGAKELQEWFVKAAVVAREFGVQINELAQYFPRQIRKELVNHIKLNPTQRRRLVAGAVGPDGKKLVGDASEIRQVLDDYAKKQGYPAGYFNDNPDEVIPRYLDALQEKMIRGRTMQHLGRGGHIDYVGKGLDEAAQLALGPGKTPLALNAGEEILDGGPGPIPDDRFPGGYRNVGGRDVSGQQFQPPLPGGGPIAMPPGRQPFAMPPVGAGDDVIDVASKVLPNPTYGPDGPIHGPYDPIEAPLTRQQQVQAKRLRKAKAGQQARATSHLAVQDALEARYPGGWKAAAADPEANLVERAVAARAISIEQSSATRVASPAFVKVDRGWTLDPELFPGSEGLVGLPAINKYLDDTVSGAGLRPYAGTAKAEAKAAGAHLRGLEKKIHEGLAASAEEQIMRGVTANVGNAAKIEKAIRALDEIAEPNVLGSGKLGAADLLATEGRLDEAAEALAEANATGVTNAMHGGPIPEQYRAPYESRSGQTPTLNPERHGYDDPGRTFHSQDVGEVTYRGPERFSVRGLEELSSQPIYNADGAIVGFEDGVPLETLRARLRMYIEAADKQGVVPPSITGSGTVNAQTQAMLDAMEGAGPRNALTGELAPPYKTNTWGQRTGKEIDAENEARMQALLAERGRVPGPDGQPVNVSAVWRDLSGERPAEAMDTIFGDFAQRTGGTTLDDGSVVVVLKRGDMSTAGGKAKKNAKIRKGDTYEVREDGGVVATEQVVPNDTVFNPKKHTTAKLREIIHTDHVKLPEPEAGALSKYPPTNEYELNNSLTLTDKFREEFPDGVVPKGGLGVPTKGRTALPEAYQQRLLAAEEADVAVTHAELAVKEAEFLAGPRAGARGRAASAGDITDAPTIKGPLNDRAGDAYDTFDDLGVELVAAQDNLAAAKAQSEKIRQEIWDQAVADGLIRKGSAPGPNISPGSNEYKYLRGFDSPAERELAGGAEYLAERFGVSVDDVLEIEGDFVVTTQGGGRFVGTRYKPRPEKIKELHHKEWVEDTVDAWNVAELATPRALAAGPAVPEQLALEAGPRQAIPMPPAPGSKPAIPMPPGPDVRPRLGAGKGLDEPVRTLRWTDGAYARALSQQPEALGRAAESMRTRIGVSQTHLQSLVDSNASAAKVSGVAEGLMSDKRAMKMLEAAAEETDPDLAHVAVLEAQAEMALGDMARKSGAYRKRAADTAPPTTVSDHAFQAAVDGGLRETLGALGRSDLAAAPGLAEIFTAVSKVRAPGAGTRFLKHYDQLLRYTKAWQTATPGFHVRNGMGGAFNNWLADIDIGAYRAYRRAKAEWTRLTDDGAKALPPSASDEVVMFDKWHSVRSRGQYSADEVALGQHHTKGSWAPWKSDNKVTRGSQDAGTWTEDYLRGALAMDRMRKGQSLELALQDVYKYHFDYGSLSQFERQYVKRVIPFYTWSRRNFPLQLEMMATRPGKYANAMKVREAISAEQRDIMPSWFADSWASPLGITSGDIPLIGSGNDQMFLTPDLPFTQTMTSPLPLGPNGLDFKRPLGMVTPLLKVPVELMTGQKFYANQGFDKERVVGGDGPGLTGGLDNVPGLLPVLKQLGVAKTAKKGDKYGRWEKGDTMLPERVAYALESFIPLMAQTQRMTPAEPGKQDRALGTVLSFLGLPLRANTERDQDLAKYFGGREP